jgi:hypothetical protein
MSAADEVATDSHELGERVQKMRVRFDEFRGRL